MRIMWKVFLNHLKVIFWTEQWCLIKWLLWPSDIIWRRRSAEWAMVRVMAWSLTAPGHYLNQNRTNIEIITEVGNLNGNGLWYASHSDNDKNLFGYFQIKCLFFFSTSLGCYECWQVKGITKFNSLRSDVTNTSVNWVIIGTDRGLLLIWY